jgi:8-oxo-dGTP pyrophosphatase MutT (NUDIX family)
MSNQPKSPRGRIRSRLLHLFFLATRPATLGVRAAVFDDQGRVFLVRHTYLPGWHFPGGGVERGETAYEALARELTEEGNIIAEEEPRLYGLYFNRSVSPRDHVAFFVLRRFRQTAPRGADFEILEARFFALNALPEGTSRATRARLAEILDGAAVARIW